MLEKWKIHWNEDGTGRGVFDIIPKVSLHPMNWIRESYIIFFTEHIERDHILYRSWPLPYLPPKIWTRTQRLLHMRTYRNCIPLCHREHSYDLLAFKEICTKSHTRMA
ncbi:hypothetical protein AVEN_273294-1 [Araneus ventricosus]|uniref:Uncharacterized protein n=1 Tax=Araneus ventricosus TaxID=182803 RepID=A0A4Y2M9X3_ARAVE|nr:hypothetical protein AVEN_273294-1 [Araneus ventricosus]